MLIPWMKNCPNLKRMGCETSPNLLREKDRRKIESVRCNHVGKGRRLRAQREPIRPCAGVYTDVHSGGEAARETVFLKLMNQYGHEIEEKEFLVGGQFGPIEIEVPYRDKEGYNAEVIPMMVNEVDHFGRHD